MFSSPYYSSYYNPYEQYDPYSQYLAQQHLAQQRALDQHRAQRLRRAQYLPHEDEDSDEELYSQVSPRDRLYLNNMKRQAALERRRREEEALSQQRLAALRQEEAWRRQEDEKREHLKRVHRQYQQAQQRIVPSPSSHSPPRIPIHTRSVSPPASKPTSPPSTDIRARPTSPEQLQNTELRNEAATKIQTTYRIHKALSSVKKLEREFESLKDSFSLPETIDFEGPEGVTSVAVSQPPSLSSSLEDTPKLAYNSTNYRLHAYVESLNKLLIKLDSIDSWGNLSVRKNRRRVAARVESEASKVDAHCKQSWAAHTTKGDEQNDEATGIVSEDSLHHEELLEAITSMNNGEDQQDHKTPSDFVMLEEENEGTTDPQKVPEFEVLDERQPVTQVAAMDDRESSSTDPGSDFVIVH